MNDMIMKAAQDPSCLLAVTPDRGGSWWAALRTGGNYPWPSDVPRNFAEEPETWYAAAAASSEISMHDFYFEIEFISYQKPESNEPVFYNIRVYEPFGVCLRNDGNIIATVTYTRLWEGSGNQYLSLLDGDFNYGEPVRIKVIRQNGVIKIFCNDTEKKTITMPSAPAPVQFTTMPSANFNGTIKRITIFDLTTGRTVWSYPSEAERVRLITKTNVRTDRGVFEAADETKTARIDTALDLRGKISDYTVFVEFEAANMDENFSAQQLCGQGSATNMSLTEIAACMYYYRDSRYFIRHAWELGGKSVLFYTEVEKLTGRHQLASILQISETGAGSSAMMYLDGKLIHTADNDNSPSGVGSAEHFTIIEPANTTQTYYSRKYGKIYSCLVFDRALTAAEIAALIPRREWVFEVEAGSISITTMGFQNQKWSLPDGSTSTAATLTGNVTAGTVICRYSGMGSYSGLIINAGSSNPAMLNTVLNINNLPPVTASLRITGVAGLAGNSVDLPRVTSSLYLNSIDDFYADAADLPRPGGILLLQNCPNITGSFADLAQSLDSFYCAGTGLTGTTADIPRATTVLNLASIAGLTGDVADLPLNSGVRSVVFCAGITGALPVTATNTAVLYHNNSSVAPEEYDQTVQNVVDAGAINGTLTISKNRTSASDANIQLLRDRGWTVVES